MAKNVVFLTGESIGTGASESIHLYRRIASFKKCGDVSIITQSTDTYPEQAGCKQVVHLDSQGTNQERAVSVVKQADMFVVVGMAPNSHNKGSVDMPNEVHREHVLRIRDMGIGTGLMFLSIYRWMMDLVED